MYYVYILECSDNSFYTGITTDIDRRIQEHNGDIPTKGARYTRARRPVQMVYQSSFNNRSEASIEEFRIKKLSKKQKQQLIYNNINNDV